jgi:hypothetical protein
VIRISEDEDQLSTAETLLLIPYMLIAIPVMAVWLFGLVVVDHIRRR